MAKFHHKRLKWLSSLSTDEAWKEIVKEATIGTTVDPERFLQKLSPLPNFKNHTHVRKWLDWVLAKIDLDMSVEEAKVLHICCDTLAALFKVARPDK
jgi:hypothetical protein